MARSSARRGSPTARRGWPRRSGGRASTPRWCWRPATAGNGRRTRWRRPAPRCTWPTRWESRPSATAGSRTTNWTPATWLTCWDIFGAWGTAWLDELPLPQPYSWKVASLRQLMGWLSAEITVLEQVTADLLAGHDGYRAVQALPGIGPVLGAVIVAEIGDITRFRHPARLCSWAGLTPGTVSPTPRWSAAGSPSRARGRCAGR